MVTVAFRIPDEMKKEMDQVDVNWSEYVRQAIQEALKSAKKRDLLRKVRQLTIRQNKIPKGTAAFMIREIRQHE